MKKALLLVAASALSVTAGSIFAFAQLPPDPNFKPDPKMNFFVTSFLIRVSRVKDASLKIICGQR